MIAASLGPVGHAAAAQHTYTVTQGGQCWEATPLGDGSKSVSDFYDYRSGNGTEFSSYGTTQLQRDQVSQLFLYRGTSGTSLVFLHDELQSSENETRTAGAITMQFSGLPADGSWVVEDDTYPNRDDNFNHSGSTSKIDWMWAPGRTDGAAFRGLANGSYDAITIEPQFGEDSWAARHRDPRWAYAEDNVTWTFRTGNGDLQTLNADESVSIRQGYCAGATPDAALDAPASVDAGTQVTLDASNSTDDGRVVEYRWDVDGDGTVENATTEATYTHRYSSTGSVEPTVVAVDDGGQTASATTTITVGDATAPAVTVDLPASVMVGQSFTASARNSTDNVAIDSYRWTFGDGTNATGETVSHSYDSNGTYNVSVRVTDTSGNVGTATHEVTVRTVDTEQPTADLAVPSEVNVGESVLLNASGSVDNNEITEYRWDVDGDGTVDETTTSPTYSHSYGSLGNRSASVTVADGHGNVDTATATVNVTDAVAPEAGVIDAPDRANVSESVSFVAANATDNHEIAAYEWSFGDGETATGSSVSHGYTETGTYTVSLTVRDTAGNTANATTTVDVADPDTSPPSPTLTVPELVAAGSSVLLDASGTTDDRGVVEYRWDVDGDGTIDNTTTTSTYAHTYTAAGNRTVRVTAVDEAGNTASASATISVTARDTESPAASLDGPKTGSPGEPVHLDASNSTDNEGITEFRWDVHGDGSIDATTTTPTYDHTYDDPGTYQPTIIAVDAAGNKGSANETIRVTVAGSPTAEIDAPESVTAGDSFTATAQTEHVDTANATFDWTFGDGSSATGENVSHSYDSNGTYNISLTVIDLAGETTTANTTITVRRPDSEPPTAALTVSDTGSSASTVQLNASASTDDVGITEYRWDVDGDGITDARTTSPTYDHTYGDSGTFSPAVTVVDAAGKTARATDTYTVANTPAPSVAIAVPDDVGVGESFTATAEAANVDTASATFDWTFGDGSSATGTSVSHSYDSDGTFDVSVTLTGPDGDTATATETVTVATSGENDTDGDDGGSGNDGDDDSGDTGGSGNDGGTSGSPSGGGSAPAGGDDTSESSQTVTEDEPESTPGETTTTRLSDGSIAIVTGNVTNGQHVNATLANESVGAGMATVERVDYRSNVTADEQNVTVRATETNASVYPSLPRFDGSVTSLSLVPTSSSADAMENATVAFTLRASAFEDRSRSQTSIAAYSHDNDTWTERHPTVASRGTTQRSSSRFRRIGPSLSGSPTPLSPSSRDRSGRNGLPSGRP
ncbi:PKD domain-containing protein [Haloarculaceae archaeon H-GB11]|nr:PKD domain-containing protein [Haloarculaceae archaeon H-GB11]